jgi:hypothetical protein
LWIATLVWSAALAAEIVQRARSAFNPASAARQPSLTACWDATAANAAVGHKKMTQVRLEAAAVAVELFTHAPKSPLDTLFVDSKSKKHLENQICH